MVDMFTDSAYE